MIDSLTRVKSCLDTTGLYTGWPGVLLAGAYVGAVLRDPRLVELTHELWSHYRRQAVGGTEFDLLSATSAMRTTCSEVKRALDIGPRSLCLYHGWVGNADVVIHGRAALADDWGWRIELAREAARQGFASEAGPLAEWVHDSSEQRNPSLMLGLAGVGYFYLRMAEPATPSVLLFGPDFVA
jgi:hypothetical protein